MFKGPQRGFLNNFFLGFFKDLFSRLVKLENFERIVLRANKARSSFCACLTDKFFVGEFLRTYENLSGNFQRLFFQVVKLVDILNEHSSGFLSFVNFFQACQTRR